MYNVVCIYVSVCDNNSFEIDEDKGFSHNLVPPSILGMNLLPKVKW